MKNENRKMDKKTKKKKNENSQNEKLLNIRSYEFQSKKRELILLKNFLQAIHKRLQKEKWTFVEIIDFWTRNMYVTGLNIISIYSIKNLINKQVIPSDQLVWKIMLYPSFLISNILFASYITEFLRNEYIPIYSRQEKTLYKEQRSIINNFPKKLYIPFFVLTTVYPLGFSIYATYQKTTEVLKVTRIYWLDSLLTLLPPLPMFLSNCFFSIYIIRKYYLNYGVTLKHKMFRFYSYQKNEIAISQGRFSLGRHIQMSLYQAMKEALRCYQIKHSNKTYKKNLDSLLKLKQLIDTRNDDVFQHLTLLISINKSKKKVSQVTNLNRRHFLKQFAAGTVTLAFLICYLFFSEIGTKIFLETNYLGTFQTANTNTLRVFNDIADTLAYIPYFIMYPFLFQRTFLFLLNRIFQYIKCFFNKESDIPIIIQQRRYLFLFACLTNLVLLVSSLPTNTFSSVSYWVLQGYDNEFNFDHVQYSGKGAFLSFYLPAIATFSYMAYPFWRLTTSVFKYIMWYFSSNEQRKEIQLEEYLKIVLQLVKTCKANPFLEVLLGISDHQLQQLFDRKDFEALLEEAYRQKGVSTSDDNLYFQIKERLLKARGDSYDEERCRIMEYSEEETEKEKNEEVVETSSTQQNEQQGHLTPRETIRLIIEMRKSEAERIQQKNNGRQIQEDENESLLRTPKGHSWLSPSWCRTARCTLY